MRINLVERTGVFSNTQENLRIVSLATEHLKVNVEPGSPDARNLSLLMSHSGLSRLRSGGQTFQFTHYRTADFNPITWETIHDGFRGTWVEATRSAASDSLLEHLLQGDANFKGSFKDLLLYSRPAAWADIVLTKEVIGGEQDEVSIDELRLKVQYDFHRKAANEVDLKVEVSRGFAPNIVLNQVDRAGRRDGRGTFHRYYSRDQRVTLEAQPLYGAYQFDRWTDARGQDLVPPATDPAVTVILSQHMALRAVYRLGAGPGEAFNRGDANADGRFDVSDAVTVLSFLFTGGAEPTCLRTADANDDGLLNITDPVFLLAYLFQGGSAPPLPFGACGVDSTPDELGCVAYTFCE